jgi:general transcription factor IIIA
MQRHVARHHNERPESSQAGSGAESDTRAHRSKPSAIDVITGKAYGSRSNSTRSLHCPYPQLNDLFPRGSTPTIREAAAEPMERCPFIFTRAYDLRRHLRAEHGIELLKEAVDAWVTERKNRDGQ